MEGFNQTPITPESNEPTADQLRVRLADLRKQMEMFGDVTAADRAEVERLAALISSKLLNQKQKIRRLDLIEEVGLMLT